MLGDGLGHVGHRPIRSFDGVPIEGAPEDMAGREALVDDVEEGAGDVGLHLLGEGWVEPSYPSLATSPRWCSRLLGGRVVGELVRVAGLLQSLLVQWGGSVEDGLTGGEPGEPVIDPLGGWP